MVRIRTMPLKNYSLLNLSILILTIDLKHCLIKFTSIRYLIHQLRCVFVVYMVVCITMSAEKCVYELVEPSLKTSFTSLLLTYTTFFIKQKLTMARFNVLISSNFENFRHLKSPVGRKSAHSYRPLTETLICTLLYRKALWVKIMQIWRGKASTLCFIDFL